MNKNPHKGWIGVDLDGTLAQYDYWRGPEHIGDPILPMLERVKKHLADGDEVRIFTARAYPLGVVSSADKAVRLTQAYQSRAAIEAWCIKHLGQVLPVTCIKDFSMWKLYDDRAKQVVQNTGVLVEDLVSLCPSTQI